MALGINNIVGVSGFFIGLVLGGVLAPIDWRLVFLISVPVGLFGTVWAYRRLRELSTPHPEPTDWAGNAAFALGLVLAMVAVTYGIRPAGGSATGWGSTKVLILLAGSVASLAAFAAIEGRSAHPMFRLSLFRIRAFTFGTLSTFLSAVARGGLMFMLVIWLQGVVAAAARLRLHGHAAVGGDLHAAAHHRMLCAGPLSGYLSDRFGARPFATAGMLLTALGFGLLLLLPTNFAYPAFGAILLLIGASMGLFASPNRAAVMSSLPPEHRGAGGAMNQTFQNSAQVLSIGIFFTLMIVGSPRPSPTRSPRDSRPTRARGHGAVRRRPSAGVDPLRRLPRLQPGAAPGRPAGPRRDPRAQPGGRDRPHLLPRPHLRPFRDGLHAAFAFAMLACLVAAAASAMRGGRTPARDLAAGVDHGGEARVEAGRVAKEQHAA
jgi:MFS family permease